MPNFLRLTFLLLALTAPAFAQRDIGVIDIANSGQTIPIRVSANTQELNSLALQAFSTHGRYTVVASNFQYDIKFSSSGGPQVRVDITRGAAGTPVHSETVSGTSARNALLRAADVAVVRTNGLGLRGYFASKLAFIGERTGKKEVYISDVLFGEVQQFTFDSSLALTPRWSPDGTKLLYTGYFRSGFPDVFLVDLVNKRRETFASFKGTNSSARFSPNGQQVAMTLSGEGTPEVYVSDARGRNAVRKTRSDAVKSSPTFSPDGTRLLFASEPGPQLYVMPVAGGAPRRVTPSGISSYCAEPDWSVTNPDKIAFTMRVGRQFQIGVLTLSTGQGGAVSRADFDGVEPSWLPDGRHLVYTARTAKQSRICILDTETGKSTPVSPATLGATMQASVWAP